ncbi:hypothetical protein Tco_1481878, partial [Tanacetum coccineum]
MSLTSPLISRCENFGTYVVKRGPLWMFLLLSASRKEKSKLSHTVVKVAKSNSIPFATKNRNDSYFCKTSSYANVVKASDNGEFKDVGDSHHSVSLQM